MTYDTTHLENRQHVIFGYFPVAAPDKWSTQERSSVISVGLSFASPGGIALETTFSINRLPAEEPGFTAGPDLPPFKIDSGGAQTQTRLRGSFAMAGPTLGLKEWVGFRTSNSGSCPAARRPQRLEETTRMP